MRPDILRTYKAVHTWVGITAGLFLFIAFFAGALTMFKEPLLRWSEPVSQQDRARDISPDQLVAQALARHPEMAKGFTVRLEGPLRLSWSQGRRDPSPAVVVPAEGDGVSVIRDQGAGLGRFIDFLHRTTGLPLDMETGTMVSGTVAGLYGMALISGLIILLPSLIKDLFALRLGKNLKRLWLDLHNMLGLFSLPFHLIMAISAVVFGWHDLFYDALNQGVYQNRGTTLMQAASPPSPYAGDKSRNPSLSVDQVLSLTAGMAPGLHVTSVEYRDHGLRSGTIRVIGEDPRYLVRGHGFLTISAADGTVINREYLPGQQSTASALVSSFFALHFGTFGGETIRWSYFILGLAGAALFYTGNLLWVESRRKPRRGAPEAPRQTRSSRILAALTIGVCLGCVGGIAIAISGTRLLQGMVPNVNAWTQGLYYGVFVVAVIAAQILGAARAALVLPWATALCLASIPLTSLALLRSVEPGVDVVTALGIVLMAVMARRAAYRAKHGPADSVWALSPDRPSPPAVEAAVGVK